MNWDFLSKVLIALFAVVAAAMKLWEIYRARLVRLNEIKTMLEIAELLPAEGEVKAVIIQHVEHRALDLIDNERTKRRDPAGIALAAIFLLCGFYLLYLAVTVNAWWWIPVAFFLPLGAFGLGQDASRRERDVKGRPIN